MQMSKIKKLPNILEDMSRHNNLVRNKMKPPRGWNIWALNGDKEKPFVKGVTGLLELYNWAIKKITFSGPTHFAGILENLYQRIITSTIEK